MDTENIQKPRPHDVTASKIGRPCKLLPTDAILKQIEELARIQCTQREAAAVMGVCLNTFTTFLGTHKKARDVWEMGRDEGLVSLRRNQFKTAETNPTMQIWLGKQYLGQSDKQDTSVQGLVTQIYTGVPRAHDEEDPVTFVNGRPARRSTDSWKG